MFVWTPVLERRSAASPRLARPGGAASTEVPLPHGLVFALFMACKMAGSQAFMLLADGGAGLPPASGPQMLLGVFALSAAAFALPCVAEGYAPALLSFCAFEFALGVYWPAMSLLRAEALPDGLRATVSSVFRVPLNLLVIGGLLVAGQVSDVVSLLICSVMMALCFRLSWRLPRGGGPMEGADGLGGGKDSGRRADCADKADRGAAGGAGAAAAAGSAGLGPLPPLPAETELQPKERDATATRAHQLHQRASVAAGLRAPAGLVVSVAPGDSHLLGAAAAPERRPVRSDARRPGPD